MILLMMILILMLLILMIFILWQYGWNHLYQRARYRDNDFVSGFNTMLLKMTHLNNDLDFNVNDDSNDKRVYFD